MKKTQIIKRIFLTLIISLTLFSGLLINNNNETEASANLQYLTTGSGSDLVYRNSSEKVAALAEYDYPIQEYRATWVSCFAGDMGSYQSETSFKSEATSILNNMERLGLNAMVFHIRTHNNALYDSELNPRATFWRNVDFDVFDPLEWLINECHSRGIEFHAWLNPYRVSDSYVVDGVYPEGHPVNDSNNLLGSILNPALQNVRDFIVDSCMEIIEKYDVDAIHFDDYFYISGVETDKSGDWKRQQVDLFIEQLHNTMTEYNTKNNRNVQLGISPSGIYRNGSYSNTPSYNSNGDLVSPIGSNTSGFAHYDNYLYSDTLKWINNGWIDYITPQSYWALEHTSASFAALTRWWSWAVANKNVNLYMGSGVYMSLTSSGSGAYWQNNPDEIKNQILNAGMYDEIDGMCYYKYSSLLSTNNNTIARGTSLMENDYYAKKVPSAVQKSYASIVPNIPISNFSIVGNEIIWDAVANVRGYMVYEVPKGATFDRNNISYLLRYTQNTSIQYRDLLNYDYYVCAVNRANVISPEVQVSGGQVISLVDNVINLINRLPSNITLENETAVRSALNYYKALSSSDKLLVTNYSVLEQAVAKIAVLKQLKTEVDTYIKTLNVDLEDGTPLSVPSNSMVWSYKDSTDVNRYNIRTGKKLVTYLSQYKITLILTATSDGVSYSAEAEFNLGLIPSQYTPLIYRNDASCLTPDDPGEHTTTSSSYIGWSNVILYIGNYALPIAKDNYHRITSTSNIPTIYWHSCAGLYHNTTANSISITPSQVFNTAAESYGYLILGANNVVKSISTTTPYQTLITINSGESIFFIRYLDRIYNNTPFIDFTSITVGTSTSIKEYENGQLTEQDKIDTVINAIATLPTVITVDDEESINYALSLYNELSEENKDKITNYNKLTQALTDLALAKEQHQLLETAKANAIQELNNYVSYNNYSSANASTIRSYISSAQTLINNATNTSDIESTVSSTKTRIDGIKTLAQELVLAKEEAKTNIQRYLDEDNYSSNYWGRAKVIINEFMTDVETVTTISELNQLVLDTKVLLDQVPTKENEVAVRKEEAINEIYELYDLDDYTRYYQSMIISYCLTTEDAIKAATSLAEIDAIITNVKNEVATYPTKTQIENAQKVGIEQINELIVDLNKYPQDTIDEVQEQVQKYTDQINSDNTLEQIQSSVEDASSDIKRIMTRYLREYKQEKAATLIDLVDSGYRNKSKVKNLVSSYRSKILASDSITEVDNFVSTFETELKAVIKDIDSGCSQNDSKLKSLIASISALSLAIFIVMKKK